VIRVWIVCRPNARANIAAALAAAGRVNPFAWVQFPQPATRDAAMPAAKFYWCGWQATLAEIQAVRAALSGIPGWRGFRGLAQGWEHTDEDDRDDIDPPDPMLNRHTRRAALVMAARQMGIA
jgi:hypothetical protein